VVVIACGWGGYLLADDGLTWPGTRITAVAGTGIGCVLLVSMLFEAWPATTARIVRTATGLPVRAEDSRTGVCW
jgi:hypothetical protein